MQALLMQRYAVLSFAFSSVPSACDYLPLRIGNAVDRPERIRRYPSVIPDASHGPDLVIMSVRPPRGLPALWPPPLPREPSSVPRTLPAPPETEVPLPLPEPS
ncbi:hypothetical protein AQI95_06385 [Streptomyces yokosukanensis]|uniref:Uncharacterized protein n=1 Tax=Streptomyces yokosukanensis TaxID=67386 RepID=A0A101PD93_9ACTN|nr:hypothetical protein AQI95_06385 [Streptomyces yokosukanensis]